MSAIEDLLMMGQVPILGETATRQELREFNRKIAKFAPQILVRHANDIGFSLYRTEVLLEYLRSKDDDFNENFLAAEKKVCQPPTAESRGLPCRNCREGE